MAAKKEKKGRLDASSLEAALNDAFNDEETVEIHGHEKAAGVDPNFAGKLHDKLEGEIHDHPERASEAEPTGLRAPACTQVLSAKDLAALDSEDEDEEKVVVDSVNHGFIDSIDSKLVTELNKKLSDEIAHERDGDKPPASADGPKALGTRGCPRGFTSNLDAALGKLVVEDNQDAPAASSKPGPRGAPRGFTRNLNEAMEKLAAEEEEEEKKDAPAASRSLGLRGAPGGFTTNLNAAMEKLAAKEVDEEKMVAPSDPFSSDLSAALNKKLVRVDNEGSVDELDRRFDINSDKSAEAEEAVRSGMRAPKPTVKLCSDVLAKLDAEDEVLDSAMMVAKEQGAIKDIDKSLVDALNARLGTDVDEDNDTKRSGLRAPMSTVKLDASMLPPDSDEDEPHGHWNIDMIDGNFVAQLQQKLEAKDHTGADQDEPIEQVGRGCRAPQVTVKLDAEMLAALDDDDDDIPVVEDNPLSVVGAAAAALSKVANAPEDIPNDTMDWGVNHDADITQESTGGLRAPCVTQLISADMLAELDDDDDDDDPMAGGPLPKTVESKNFAASFADSLQDKLAKGTGKDRRSVGLSEGNPDEAITPDAMDDQEPIVTSGLKAPCVTCNLTADQLAQLDSDDDVDDDAPERSRRISDDSAVERSGVRAPACTQVISAEMLAGIDDDVEDAVIQCGEGPSAEQLATLNAASAALGTGPAPVGEAPTALTMNSGYGSKVIQSMQGSGPWGQAKPPSSSCKLRLAWLSKEEVSKENDQLRKEINSLRVEIEMHRKEATLARKA